MAVHAGRALFEQGIGDRRGNAQRGVLVWVYDRGTSNLSTLYTDRTKATEQDNPITTNGLGNLAIFADPGDYEAHVESTGAVLYFTVLPDWQDTVTGDEPEGGLPAHLSDAVDAHDASAISFTPAGSIAATDVQAAVVEVATDYAAADTAHLNDTSAAHVASAVGFTPAAGVAATDVQAAIVEVAGDVSAGGTALADHLADTVDSHDASAVSFVPTGGIAATTVQAALVELDSEKAPRLAVNVADKGADMTGVTGGRAALLLALTDVAAGGEILVPAGTLLLDTAVTTITTPRLRIKGEGMWASTIKAGFAGAMFNGDNTFATMIEELLIEDICIDLAGLATVGFAFNANTTLKRMVCHNVRFTNIALADAIRIASGNLYLTGNTLFHNPAAHAGRGKAILVGVGGRVHWENTVESHWLGQDFASPAGSGSNREQDINEAHYIGGYHDQYWPYIPASMSGSGGTVTYDATSVTDTGADFTSISAAAYPNVALLRAMPVRQTGTVTTASDMQLIDTAATFVANGTKRGDIVRVAGKWAIVEAVQSETVLNVLKWFDNTTLRPITRPAIGTAYTVYGFIYGFAESKTGTTKLNVRYWTDFFGVRTTPSAGTLYEIMQARPSQMLAPGYGTRAMVIPHGARFFRGWADMAGTAPARSIIRGHFKDGQDLGITIAGHDCDVDALVEHCGAGGVWVAGDNTSIGGKFIGNCWNFDNASQPLTPVSISGVSRCVIKPGTLFKKGTEGTQAVTATKMVGTGSLNSVLDIINDGYTNDLDVVASTMTKCRIRGIAPVVISSGGTGTAMVNDGHRRYLTSDVASTTNASLTDLTGLGFPVEANEVWEFDAFIVYDSTTTNDLRLALNVPASATETWGSDGLSSAATSFLGDINDSVTTSTTYEIIGGARAAGAAVVKVKARMRGLVTVGATAGTVVPRFSKNLNTDTATPADDATVYAGSFLVARRIA